VNDDVALTAPRGQLGEWVDVGEILFLFL